MSLHCYALLLLLTLVTQVIPQSSTQISGKSKTLTEKQLPRLVSQHNDLRFEDDPYPGNVTFSPDGKLFAISGQNEITQVWEVKTGRLLRDFPADVTGANGDVTSPLAFSNDNEWLARGSEDRVTLYNVLTGKTLFSFRTLPANVDSSWGIQHISISKDRRILYVTQDAPRSELFETVAFDIVSKKVLSRQPAGSNNDANHPSESSKIEWIKRLRDLHTAETRLRAVSPEFAEMKTASCIFEVLAVSTDVAAIKQSCLKIPPNNVDDVIASPPGSLSTRQSADLIAFGPLETRLSEDKVVRIVKLTNGSEISRLQGYANTDISDDLAWQTVVDPKDADVVLLDDQVKRGWKLSPNKPENAVFSSNNKYAAFRTQNGEHGSTFLIWQFPLSNIIKTISWDRSASVEFISTDGKFAVLVDAGTSREQRNIYVVSTADSSVIATFPYNRVESVYDNIDAFALSPNDKLLAVFQGNEQHRHLLVWDIAGRRALWQIPILKTAYQEGGSSLIFSDDSRLLASPFYDGVLILNVQTGKQTRLVGHELDVSELIFSPDGLQVATNGFDHTARVWSTVTGKERFRIIEPGDSIKFSSDMRYLYSNSVLYRVVDGTEVCRFYTLPSGMQAIVASDGRFEINDFNKLKGLHWVMPSEPFRTLPIEIFSRDYFEPDLLSRLLDCDRVKTCTLKSLPNVAELNRVQPIIGVPNVSPQRSDGSVDVTVLVENHTETLSRGKITPEISSGVYDLRLFRDGQMVGSSTPKEAVGTFIRAAPALVEEGLALKSLIDRPEDKAWRETHDLTNVAKFDAAGKASYTFKNIQLPHDGRKDVEFSAYAFNSDRVKSDTVRTVYQIENPTVHKGTTYLVSIGVNASESESFRLDFAANDARKMQEVLAPRLEASGQNVVQIPLISDYNAESKSSLTQNAATKTIIKAVFDLLAGDGTSVPAEILEQIPNCGAIHQVQPEDTVIIAYSGHGYVDGSGIFYLVPFDIGKTTTTLTKQVLPRLISSDELSLWMREITAREMIMIVDACHSAAAVQGPGFKPGPMGSRGLGQLAYDKGIKILSATQADNVALEMNSLSQGLLSFALLEDGIILKKADSVGADQKLSAREWLSYGESRVPTLYDEIRSGKHLIRVNGKTRSDRVDLFGGDTVRTVQQPKLFDFTRKNNQAPLMLLR